MGEIRSLYGENTAFLNADSNGGTDIEMVAAKANHIIVVDYLAVGMSAAGLFFLESGASTVISPTLYVQASDTVVLDHEYLVQTVVGEALNFNATITGNVSFLLKYHYEPTFT